MRRRDDGAIAILLSVVLVAVLLPLGAYGVTTYLRSGMGAELQRAADAGAVAGAAKIPLAKLDDLKSFLETNTGPLGMTAALIPADYIAADPGNRDPLIVAKATCEAALAADDSIGQAYAIPYGAPTCTAEYTDDSSFFGDLGDCVGALPANALATLGLRPSAQALLGPLLPVLSILSNILSILGGVLNQVVPDALGPLLPALLKPGVKVTASWDQRGPLDALDPGDDGQPHGQSRTALAQRHFRNVVVVPQVGVNDTLSGLAGTLLGLLGLSVKNAPQLPVGGTIDLNPALGAVVGQTLNTLNTLGSKVLGLLGPACANLVPDLTGDLSDLLDPPSSGAPTAGQVLTEAAAGGQPVLALVIPTPSTLTNPLQIPFLSFVPVCLDSLGGRSIPDGGAITATVIDVTAPDGAGACTLAGPGMFKGRLTK